MAKHKLLLINPVYSPSGPGRDRGTNMPPLSLAYLAARTPDHYDIKIVDEYVEPLSFEPADIVGITSFSSHILRAYEIAQHYRRLGATVIMGGVHVSMRVQEALEYCDTVVAGEAEDLWPRVLEDFENGTLKETYKGPLVDIDTLPLPRRDLFKRRAYIWGNIQTSRGCPMNCSYCSVTRFNGLKFRRRPVEAVIEELEQIKQKYVFFLDDNLLGHDDKSWLVEFFSQIIKRQIKKIFFSQISIQFGEDIELIRLAAKAGLKIVFVGLESINHESLTAYNKNLNAGYVKANRHIELINNIRKGGIAFMGGFLLGGDNDRVTDFRATLDFLKQARVDVLQMTKPTPLPGTAFFEELDRDGRIFKSNYPHDWKDYRFTRMVYRPKNMTIDQVYHGFHWLKQEYYRFPVQLRRHLRTLIDTRSLSATLISIIMNRAYEKYFRESDLYQEIEINGGAFSAFKHKLEMGT